jgi:RNA polymerase sigma-70 factor, ECF subfamily
MLDPDRTTTAEGPELAAVLAGDADAFRTLTDKYARELHLHCYRMLGSFHDAEDGLQETLLRAWRYRDTFEGRSSFRTWLYRIATNACLRQGRRRQKDPPVVPAVLADEVARRAEPVANVSPYPDAWLDELAATSADPAAEYDLRESVQLAFLAALQLLPPRQRAVLVLRDVLGWTAAEVAELLETTTASVNNALQRARTTLEQQRAAGRLDTARRVPTKQAEQSLLQQYMDAWCAADMGTLASLLKNEVVLTMPPFPLRYVGRDSLIEFLVRVVRPASTDGYRLLPTRANRQPAVAVYRLDPARNAYTARGVHVLTMDGDAVAEFTAFADASLVPLFGCPSELARE